MILNEFVSSEITFVIMKLGWFQSGSSSSHYGCHSSVSFHNPNWIKWLCVCARFFLFQAVYTDFENWGLHIFFLIAVILLYMRHLRHQLWANLSWFGKIGAHKIFGEQRPFSGLFLFTQVMPISEYTLLSMACMCVGGGGERLNFMTL